MTFEAVVPTGPEGMGWLPEPDLQTPKAANKRKTSIKSREPQTWKVQQWKRDCGKQIGGFQWLRRLPSAYTLPHCASLGSVEEEAWMHGAGVCIEDLKLGSAPHGTKRGLVLSSAGPYAAKWAFATLYAHLTRGICTLAGGCWHIPHIHATRVS